MARRKTFRAEARRLARLMRVRKRVAWARRRRFRFARPLAEEPAME